jgi:predicted nucleic acid-binding protein
LSWFFEDERDKASLATAKVVADGGAVVPPLFRYEVQNGLLVAQRRKRISKQQLEACLAGLDDLDFIVDCSASLFSSGIDLARRFSLTAYDAAYLELAVRRSSRLMTRDKLLKSAASEMGLLWK